MNMYVDVVIYNNIALAQLNTQLTDLFSTIF